MPFLPSVASTSSAVASSSRGPLLQRLFITLAPAHKKVPAPVYDPARDVLSLPADQQPKWTALSKRAGTIMTKIGMTTVWDKNGVMIPCTVLQLEDCQVVKVIPPRHNKLGRPKFQTLQIGAYNLRKYIIDPIKRQALGLAPTRKTNEYNRKPSLIGQFAAQGVPPKRVLQEFRVSDDALLPVGATFSVAHYVPGQHVDVQSTSIGKGWAGAMKRWNFSGGNDSHGASKSHRSAGSTGQNQDPGRVLPGKKMAGRMGGRSSTTHNLLVQRIDLSMNLVFLKGTVPGAAGSVVRVTDALSGVIRQGRKNLFAGKEAGELLRDVETLPFPLGTPELAETLPMVIDAAPRALPPGQGALS